MDEELFQSEIDKLEKQKHVQWNISWRDIISFEYDRVGRSTFLKVYLHTVNGVTLHKIDSIPLAAVYFKL